MSSTEIYGLTKNRAMEIGEARNSFRGAMLVWKTLEEKYLPSFPKPVWMPSDSKEYVSRTSMMMMPNAMKEVWDLIDSDKLSFNEKIVLGTTYDNVLVKAENISRVIDAFNSFEGDTTLKEQADIISQTIKNITEQDEPIVAIGWNQTSVNESPWSDYSEEEDEDIGYNLETGDKHWFLFDDLKEGE
jgi:hypothetical protein